MRLGDYHTQERNLHALQPMRSYGCSQESTLDIRARGAALRAPDDEPAIWVQPISRLLSHRRTGQGVCRILHVLELREDPGVTADRKSVAIRLEAAT